MMMAANDSLRVMIAVVAVVWVNSSSSTDSTGYCLSVCLPDGDR